MTFSAKKFIKRKNNCVCIFFFAVNYVSIVLIPFKQYKTEVQHGNT